MQFLMNWAIEIAGVIGLAVSTAPFSAF